MYRPRVRDRVCLLQEIQKRKIREKERKRARAKCEYTKYMFDNKVAGLSVRIRISNRQCGKIKGREKSIECTHTYWRYPSLPFSLDMCVCARVRESKVSVSVSISRINATIATLEIIVIRCSQVYGKLSRACFCNRRQKRQKQKYCKS